MSGYLGLLISNELKTREYDVSGVNRNLIYGPVESLKNEIRGTDIIINLAGAPILQRWTKNNKNTIYNSRVVTTQNLVKAIGLLTSDERPKKFISASATGIYKSGRLHDESSFDFDTGFIGKVTKAWEDASGDLPSSIQKIIFRIGPVLGKQAKTVKKMMLPFRIGFGATLGGGKQAFLFIHENDVKRAFIWAVEEYSNSGIFNLVAPQNISNSYFTKKLATKLNRPAILNIPGFFLKLFFGKAAVLLTESAEVYPAKLLKAGFAFHYPDLDSTLDKIV
jgi:hypothetical protein